MFSILLNFKRSFAVISLLFIFVSGFTSDADKRIKALEKFSVQTDQNGNVSLSWIPNADLESELFSIERSIDGVAWFKIAEIHPLESRPITRSYEFVDNAPISGVSFYRIKSIAETGERYNASPEMVYLENDEFVKIFPNSETGQLCVYLKKSILIGAQLFGPSGIPIEVNFLNEGYSFKMDTKELNPGKYNLTIITKDTTINRQVMLM